VDGRQRFWETMRYGNPDRVPYFEEGIRREVLKAWRAQGMPRGLQLSSLFYTDHQEEIQPDMDPHPAPRRWPASPAELRDFQGRLEAEDPRRLPRDWPVRVAAWQAHRHVLLLRVHRGFFLSLGVHGWRRFNQVMRLLVDDPEIIRQVLEVQGRFAARLAERVLRHVQIDAAVFSEPIGGNHGPLISPRMYEEIVMPGYLPLMDVLRQHGVEIIILRTYANARVLIPVMLKWGFNCLWACECAVEAMKYRELRSEFGRDLRLIGGIDLDILRKGKEAIHREVMETVPPLVAEGGYVPLADGRVRADVPYENYLYYRRLLEEATQA